MSQSIRISSGLSPILQRIPNNNTSSSCMEVGFPISNFFSSVKAEYRKRAAAAAAAGLSMVVSNRNHPRLPFLLPCAAATRKSNVDDDEGDTDTSSEGEYDSPKAWRTILSNFRSKIGPPPQVTKGAVVLMIRMDLHDPIDGLKILLDASRSWRMFLSLCTDKLYDPERFDNYGQSYLHNARNKEGGSGSTNKRKHNNLMNSPPPTTLITKLAILRALANLNDPYINGLEVLLGALEEWRVLFSSDELNDSEGYLQREIFAIRDLSQRVRIFVSNHNNKHHKARLPQLTRVMDLLKVMVDNFEDPSDAVNAMSKAFDYGIYGCDEPSRLLAAAVAKLNF